MEAILFLSSSTPSGEYSIGILPAPLPPVPPATADTGAIIAPVIGGEDSGAVGTAFTSIFEDIEALGLTLVMQGKDNPPPAGFNLDAGLVPLPPPSPCPSPPALVPGAPLALPGSHGWHLVRGF